MHTTAFTTHDDQAPRRKFIYSHQESAIAVLLVLHESQSYSNFSRFSNAAVFSFAKVPECCDFEVWRQVDEKWWPQFHSSTTQTMFLNRPGCMYLEVIRLKVATTDSCPLSRTRRTQ